MLVYLGSQQTHPGVAKFGIALEWGSRGLEFESRHSDQKSRNSIHCFCFFLFCREIRTIKCKCPVGTCLPPARWRQHFDFPNLDTRPSFRCSPISLLDEPGVSNPRWPDYSAIYHFHRIWNRGTNSPMIVLAYSISGRIRDVDTAALRA